jgi:siroheme synthase (precorrin-2 oxidase/ferrochelatase)
MARSASWNHPRAAGAVRESIAAVLAHLDQQIVHVRQLIRDHLDQHPGLRTSVTSL